MNIPPEGILLPTLVTLPDPTISVAAIRQNAIQMGFNIPKSYNRQETVGEMRNIFQLMGYRSGEGNQMVRDESVRLMPNEVFRALAQATPIFLPTLISRNVFETKESLITFITVNNLRPYIRSGGGRLKTDLARDLRTFLAEKNYAVDRGGNFIRESPLEVAGGYEYQDLIRPATYLQFIQSPELVVITQTDLVKLQLTLQELVSLLTRRRWNTLEEFMNDIVDRFNINPSLALFVSLLARLHLLTQTEIQEVITKPGDVTVYKTNKQRQEVLIRHFRARISLITQTYPESTNLKSEMKTHEDSTFDDVIAGGYNFDPEDFRTDIQGNLYENISKVQLNFLAQLYRKYPSLYDMSKEWNSRSNTITHKILELYYDETPSYPQYIYSFTVNYPILIPESEERTQRRTSIKELPRRYLDTLYGIYMSPDIEIILDMSINPLEQYLYILPKITMDQLYSFALRFGMIIPEHLVRSEWRDHILQEMPAYRGVLINLDSKIPIAEAFKEPPDTFNTFSDGLTPYGDQEIIAYFGYQGWFGNREGLIDNIFTTVIEESFMIFQDINEQKASNAETSMLTLVKDIPRPYLVFGTPFQYRVLELDELIQSFRGGRFTVVGNETHVYTDSQVNRLKVLLTTMKQTNPSLSTMVEQLLKYVDSGLVAKLRRSAEVDHLIRSIEYKSIEQKELIKKIFYQVFYSGMYTRRWKGPGNRYPVHGAETLGNYDPQPQSIMALENLFSMIKEVDPGIDLNEIYEIEYHVDSGSVVFTESRLFPFLEKVALGTHCIRLASKRIIISAWYYIGVIFGEAIPNFSPSEVEEIG